MTSSTVSRLSALRSLAKLVSRVISDLSTPICSATMSMTLASISASVTVKSPENHRDRAIGPKRPQDSRVWSSHQPAARHRSGPMRLDLHGQAAIHDKNLTGYVRRRIRREERDGVGDFPRRAEPPDRNALGDLVLQLLSQLFRH